MVKGDQCWIIENGSHVLAAEILSFSGNLVLIKTQKGNILRLPKHRLFKTEESAMEVIHERRPVEKKNSPYDYMV